MSRDGRDEQEDSGRQLDQLLQELRVAIPGVQMLFGFLLTVPFNERFQQLGHFAKGIFFLVFSATTLSCVALIAPSAFNRIHKGNDVSSLLSVANKLSLIGLGFLGVAIVGSTYLITAVAFGSGLARIAALVAAVATGGAWLVLPIVWRTRDRERASGRTSVA